MKKSRLMLNVLLVTAVLACPVSSAQLTPTGEIVALTAPREFSVVQGRDAKLILTAEILPGWHVNSDKPSQEYLLPTRLDLVLPPGITAGRIVYPAAAQKTFSFSELPLSIFEGTIEFHVPVIAGSIEPGKQTISAELFYQACNDEKCMPPARTRADVSIEILSASPGAAEERISRLIHEKGWILALLAIFAAGLALNLTPCVYPMIPITMAYFGARRPGSSRAAVVRSAVAYFFGIVISYSVLGTAAGLSGGLFGSVMQNPFVLIAVALLMTYLAAGMFGWMPFALPSAMVQKIGSGQVPFGTFGMGVTMGVVAAPCVGPVVSGLLIYVGIRQSAFEGFLLFSVLGAGLGLPYLALGLFSEKLSALPKLGAWMDVIKWIFGFFLLGMAVYFIAPLISDEIESKLYAVILFVSAITLFYSFWRRGAAALIAGLLIFAVLTTAAYRLWPDENSMSTVDDGFWVAYDSSSFEAAFASGRPVLLDFFAEWCAPCVQLDRVTFSDTGVRAALEPFVRLKLDLTLYDTPESQNARRRFRITGVPTTIVFDSGGKELLRYEGFFPPEQFLSDLRGIRTR